VIDNESRFWLATRIAEKRGIADARQVLAQASSLSRTRPMAVVTDGLRAYQDAIPRVLRDENSEDTAFLNPEH